MSLKENIDFSQVDESKKELVEAIIDASIKAFEGSVELLYIEGEDKDELIDRRFAVYFCREIAGLSMMTMGKIFNTTFQGVYLDHGYINENIIKKNEKFISAAKRIVDKLPKEVIPEKINKRIYFEEEKVEETNDSSTLENTNESKKVTNKDLIKMAFSARENSYAPYSKFYVGAAILCEDGSVYTGCNVENASYGLTNCAERTAIFKAVSEGKTKFSRIVIAGEKYCVPCGACLQVMSEFCKGDFEILLAKSESEVMIKTLDELMPVRFTL